MSPVGVGREVTWKPWRVGSRQGGGAGDAGLREAMGGEGGRGRLKEGFRMRSAGNRGPGVGWTAARRSRRPPSWGLLVSWFTK